MAAHVELASAYMSVIPSLRGGGAQLRNQITGSIGAGVGAAIGLKIASGIGSVINVAKDIVRTGIDETMDASAGIAQLEAGIKSTGGAAGVTVAEMVALAGTIQNYSGQTDDSIVKTQGLLLTFTNIKNAGPDKIFDKATIAAADMAAKFGGEASSQAVVLGKALNDPVKGITALTRVGVGFTDQQKEQIKTMVASGDTIGAQKVILGELEKQFGGAARAAGESLPGQLERGKRAFEDLSQSVVETFLPALTPIVEKLPGMFEMVAPIVQGAATAVMQAFTGIWDAGQNVVTFLKEHETTAKILGITLGILVAGLIVWTAVQWALNAAMAANPISLIIIGIAALIVAILFLVANWDQVVAFITQIWGGFVNWLIGIITNVAVWWLGVWQGILGFITGVWNNIVSFVQNAALTLALVILIGLNMAQNWVNSVLNAIGGFFTSIWNNIVNFVRSSAIAIALVILVGLNMAQNWVSSVLNAIGGFFSGMFNLYLSIVRNVFNFIVGAVSGGLNAAYGVVTGVLSAISGFWNSVWNGLVNAVQAAVNGVGSVVSGIAGIVMGAVSGAGSWLVDTGRQIIAGLAAGISGAAGMIYDAVAGAVSNVIGTAKNILGIKSPSTVMAKEVGQWIPAGVAVGIDDNADMVQDSIDAMLSKPTKVNGQVSAMFDAVKPDSLSSISDQLVASGVAGNKTGPQVNYNAPVYGFDPEEAPRKWEQDLADASAVAGLRNEGKVI